MTALEQKRFDYIKEKHQDDEQYSDAKIEFLVRTGLTFDPSELRKDKPEEDKHIDWYYPKGAGFVEEDDSSSDDSSDDDLISELDKIISSDPDGPDVISVNPETGEPTSEHISQSDPITVVTTDDNEVITDADGNMIIIK